MKTARSPTKHKGLVFHSCIDLGQLVSRPVAKVINRSYASLLPEPIWSYLRSEGKVVCRLYSLTDA